MYDLVASNTSEKKYGITRNVLILNGKVNKEAGAICFELRVPRKKNKEIFQKVPSKIHGSNLIMEKIKNIFWFVNISKYHHREMRLLIENSGHLLRFAQLWQQSFFLILE